MQVSFSCPVDAARTPVFLEGDGAVLVSDCEEGSSFVGGDVRDVVEGIYVVSAEVDPVGFSHFRLRVGFCVLVELMFLEKVSLRFFELFEAVHGLIVLPVAPVTVTQYVAVVARGIMFFEPVEDFTFLIKVSEQKIKHRFVPFFVGSLLEYRKYPIKSQWGLKHFFKKNGAQQTKE